MASLGDVAASGGYLAAAGADLIVAEPSTLTGSIGVFAAKPDLSGLLERLSVHREAFARGEKADALSLMHPFTPAERATLQHQIDAFYSLFLDRVAEGRHLSRELVEASASGRVFTGRQALERHLIDRLGTLADAIALAESAAGLESDEAVTVRREGAFASRGLSLLALAPKAEEPSLATLWRAAPELKPLLLLAEGRLGPILALPEEWLAREPR